MSSSSMAPIGCAMVRTCSLAARNSRGDKWGRVSVALIALAVMRNHLRAETAAHDGPQLPLMNPSRTFVLRPVATSLLMIAIMLVGMAGLRYLPLSALPQI